MDLQSLTLQELDLLVSLVRTRSIRELARRQGQLPGQVSKALKRLENKMQKRLVERSVRGVVLTHEGLRVLPIFEDILARAETLRDGQKQQPQQTLLGVGSTSFLINHHLVPCLSVPKLTSSVRFRFLEISPDQFTNAGLRHAFEIAFHFGRIEWPSTWFQEKIGEVGWNLCCNSLHPLAKKKTLTPADVLKYKFILPSYWTQEGFSLGDDGGPIAVEKRIKGHETSTAEAAMALVRATDQVAFLPNILIRAFEQRGEVHSLNVRGWETANRPLYLAVRSDLISKKFYQEIREAVVSRL